MNSEEKIDILFFVPDCPALDSPILHAQVLSVAAFLKQEGFHCCFAGAESTPSRAHEAVHRIRQEYDVSAFVVPTLPVNSGARQWLSCRMVYRQLVADLPGLRARHVYARSFIGSMWARRLAQRIGALSVFDMRGVVGWEQQLKPGSSWKARACSFIELRESRLVHRLSTVSDNMRRYLAGETGRSDIAVIPSCFNEKSFYFDPGARTEIRDSLGVTDRDIVLCYSGGTGAWQRVDDIIDLLKGVCAQHDGCKALFLTSNQQEMTQRVIARGFPTDRVLIRSCPHKDVYRFLSAADIGIIMRHDIPLNNVASPVKVGEYLGCGLPVILTRGIGDYSDSLSAAGVGLLLDETKDTIQQVCSFIAKYDFANQRAVAVAFAKSKLTMSANLDRYRALYASRS